MSRKSLQIFFLTLCINIISVQVYAEIKFVSSANPVGSGARAVGMGGAFIAIADDATAASWNPAGLVQLQVPEVSVAGTFFNRTEDNTFGIHPEADGNQSVSDTDLNYLSVVYPFRLFEKNMVFSVSYQHLYDFAREWNFSINGESHADKYRYYQKGKLSAIGIAYAFEVSSRLSLGITVNFWNDRLTENKWESNLYTTIIYDIPVKNIEHYSLEGVNFNFGVRWEIFKDDQRKLIFGAILKTPFEANIGYEGSFCVEGQCNNTLQNLSMRMPISYGIGIAYKFSDTLIVSSDIYKTQWNEFVLSSDAESGSEKISSPIISQSPFKSTYQLRLGAEYFIITKNHEIPLRFGLFYDPAPTEQNIDNIFGFALGSGIGYKLPSRQIIIFDIAYQYRFGKNIGDSNLTDWNFSQNLSEHKIYSSLIFRF